MRNYCRSFVTRCILVALLACFSAFVPAYCQEENGLQPQGQTYEEMLRKVFGETLEKAKAGNAEEQYELSRMYRGGVMVEEDEKEAAYWLNKAAENGCVQAQVELGESLARKKDYAAAFPWFLKAAQAGDADAQSWTSELYLQGNGVEKNYVEAMKWNLKAAEQNNPTAMTNIGYMYEYGMGVNCDYKAAIEWYRLAADAGDPMAKANIGAAYMAGRGVDRDVQEGLRWLKIAADEGLGEGQFSLAMVYLSGEAGKKDPEKGVSLLEEAAQQGNEKAIVSLAQIYLTGDVPEVKKNPDRALELLQPIAEKGNGAAQALMGLAEDLQGKTEAAQQWYTKAAAHDEDVQSIFALAELYSRWPGKNRKFERAAELYARANELAENPTMANNAGWFFATCEDPKYRNPELALKYGLRAVELTEGKVPAFLDTLAEAYFINANYERAVSTEQRVLEMEPQNEDFRKSLDRFLAALQVSKAKAQGSGSK